MKRIIIITLLLTGIFHLNSSAQEKYGKTLNLGLGIGGYYGYYGYVGRSMPVFHVDYELDVAKNFTLAPFISFYTFSDRYYWGGPGNPPRYYNYRETVVPVGVKGTYYFDDLLKAGSKWDFYLAGSLGLAIVNSHWDDGYNGDRNYYHGGSSLFLDLHVGTEYHFNNRIGAFLDLSTGVSTIGIAIH
jgi:hypothetical protein